MFNGLFEKRYSGGMVQGGEIFQTATI